VKYHEKFYCLAAPPMARRFSGRLLIKGQHQIWAKRNLQPSGFGRVNKSRLPAWLSAALRNFGGLANYFTGITRLRILDVSSPFTSRNHEASKAVDAARVVGIPCWRFQSSCLAANKTRCVALLIRPDDDLSAQLDVVPMCHY